MTANSTPESHSSVLAILAEMRHVTIPNQCGDEIERRAFLAIADRLQSAHARELAERSAAFDAARELMARDMRKAEARADAAMGLVAKWRVLCEAGNSCAQCEIPDHVYNNCADELEQALAGGERKDG